MFDTLSDRLQDAFKNLTGKGTLSEENIKDAMKDDLRVRPGQKQTSV